MKVQEKIIDYKKRLEKNNYLKDIFAFIGYLIITVIFTYPLILNLRTSTYLTQDAYMWISYFSWFKKAIIDLNVSPLYNPHIFYPIGEYFLGDASLELLLFTPVTLFFGPIAAYNSSIISSFILSGFGTYLLVKYLTNSYRSAFIAGIIFAFSPFHIYHVMGHLHIMSIQWIPFFILYLFKMMKEKTYSSMIICAIFYAFSALSSWYFAVFLMIFTIVYMFHLFIFDKKLIWNIKLIPLFIMFISIVSVSIYPFLKNFLSMPLEDTKKPIGEFIIWSSDLTGYIVPSLKSGMYSILFGDFLRTIYENYTGIDKTGIEKTVFVGYSVLFLAIYAIIKIKNENTNFFTKCLIIFFILSLGPILQIFGKYSLFQYDGDLINIQFSELFQIIPFPLPFSLLYFIPFTDMTRSPSRYAVIVMLCLSVLAGYAIKEFLNKYRYHNIKQKIFLVFITMLILFEFYPILKQPSPVISPDFYYKLANESEQYTILEIPTAGPFMEFLYFQSIHGKDLIGGYTSRQGNAYYNRVLPFIPILRDFRYVGISKEKYPHLFNDILNQNNSEIGTTVLNYFNIKYIIIHLSTISEIKVNDTNETISLIDTILGNVEPTYKNDQIIVYEVKKEKVHVPFLMLDDNWSHVEMKGDKPMRWIGQKGNIKIVSPDRRNVNLRILIESFSISRTLNVSINGRYLNSYKIDHIYGNNNMQEIIISSVNISEGVNTLELYSPEKPLITEFNQEISLVFKEISLVIDSSDNSENKIPLNNKESQ